MSTLMGNVRIGATPGGTRCWFQPSTAGPDQQWPATRLKRRGMCCAKRGPRVNVCSCPTTSATKQS